MTFDQSVILGLASLLIFQTVYLTMTINKLTDKLMSRNYAEYVQANNPVPDKVRLPQEPEPVEDLNTLFGLGPMT